MMAGAIAAAAPYLMNLSSLHVALLLRLDPKAYFTRLYVGFRFAAHISRTPAAMNPPSTDMMWPVM